MNSIEIYLNKSLKIILPERINGEKNNLGLVATFSKNLESIGYYIHYSLFEEMLNLTSEQIIALYDEVIPLLKKMRGSDVNFKPMYPNFPKQVMEMSEYELYHNAVLNYIGFAISDQINDPTFQILPSYNKKNRPSLNEECTLAPIKLGDEKDFMSIFTNIAYSNSSLSENNKNILQWFVKNRDVISFLPNEISQKETLAMIVAWSEQIEKFSSFLKTPTDVLRVLTVMSNGDVSLAENTKYVNVNRKNRKIFLNCLEKSSNLTEDMLLHKNKWIKVGEILHPGEFKSRFPKTYQAFNVLRNDIKFETFNSKVEKSILNNKIHENLDLLSKKPGIFARRLDKILRTSQYKNLVVNSFAKIVDEVSTPVLMQMYNHFKYYGSGKSRAFFPKGNVSKVKLSEPKWVLSVHLTEQITSIIERSLIKRFSLLPSLGKVNIDENLNEMLVPFAMRSASKTLKTIAKGSKIAIEDGNFLRFFLWWKQNPKERVDIDLSASIFDSSFKRITDISYYNLKELNCFHSGDITSAPNGACEFIDIPMNLKARYVVMIVNSYTQQKYCDLPECFAGWMLRKDANSGEIFEAKTVQNKIDLSSQASVSVPLIIDLKERKVIWTDAAYTSRQAVNNAFNSDDSILRAFVELNRPNLYDLFSLHKEAREDKDANFETNFTTEDAFNIDVILSQYLK